MKTASGQMALFSLDSDPGSRRRERSPHRQRAPAPCAQHRPRGTTSSSQRRLRDRAFEVFAETLFPTRCAVCDAPGTPLCAACTARLPYIDALLACPVCGAPFGRVQCTECNRVLLEPFGYERPPYDGAASPCVLTEKVRRVVTVYKDQGERGLARPMAAIMARTVPRSWLDARPVVSFVPATAAARRRRGFDHAEHLARELSWILELDTAPLLATPRRLDQRRLSRTRRIENMRAALSVLPGATMPGAVILVDDVCTTGSTLYAATEALKKGGTETVYAITFARA